MVEEDFKELAAAGVTMLGEVGLGSVKDGATARQMVAWARKYGIQSTIHTGGPSIPGSSLIDKDIVLAADADVIGHINGGHTALPDDQIVALCEQSPRALEVVHNGNERESGAADFADGERIEEETGSSDPGHGFTGWFGSAAAGNSADDCDAVIFRERAGGNLQFALPPGTRQESGAWIAG